MFEFPPDVPPPFANVIERTHPDDRPLVDHNYPWASESGEVY